MSSEEVAVPAEKKKHRAKIAQERSHATRRQIIKAALHFWNSRGFDRGFEETTVGEIADYANISRATVYYYFPKKEDILRELGWLTAEEIYESASRSLMTTRVVDEVLDDIMKELGQKVSKTPRNAISRMLMLQGGLAENLRRDSAEGGLSRALTVVLTHAREMGEIPESSNPRELGEILTTICSTSMSRWSVVGDVDLTELLRRRTAFVLAAARAEGGGAPALR